MIRYVVALTLLSSSTSALACVMFRPTPVAVADVMADIDGEEETERKELVVVIEDADEEDPVGLDEDTAELGVDDTSAASAERDRVHVPEPLEPGSPALGRVLLRTLFGW